MLLRLLLGLAVPLPYKAQIGKEREKCLFDMQDKAETVFGESNRVERTQSLAIRASFGWATTELIILIFIPSNGDSFLSFTSLLSHQTASKTQTLHTLADSEILWRNYWFLFKPFYRLQHIFIAFWSQTFLWRDASFKSCKPMLVCFTSPSEAKAAGINCFAPLLQSKLHGTRWTTITNLICLRLRPHQHHFV